MRTMEYPFLGPDTALGNLSQGVSLGSVHGVGGGLMGSMGGMGAIGAPGIGALHGRQVPCSPLIIFSRGPYLIRFFCRPACVVSLVTLGLVPLFVSTL